MSGAGWLVPSNDWELVWEVGDPPNLGRLIVSSLTGGRPWVRLDIKLLCHRSHRLYPREE